MNIAILAPVSVSKAMKNTILLMLVGLTAGCMSVKDSLEDRQKAASDYLAAVSTEAILNDIVNQSAAGLPENRRDHYRIWIKDRIRTEVIEEATSRAMIKNFTADEIDSMTKFYGSENGLSVIKKLPAYSADLLPSVEREMFRVMSTTSAPWAGLQWKTRFQEKRANLKDREISAEYTFVNSSANPVTILSVTNSPYCKVSEISRKTYQPGESGRIGITFEIGDHTGRNLVTATLKTDDPAEVETRLSLIANVPEILSITNRFLFWEYGGDPTEQMVSVRINTNIHNVIVSRIAVDEAFSFRTEQNPTNRAESQILILPKDTSRPSSGKLTVTASVGENTKKSFDIFLRIMPSESGPQKKGWSGDILWIDARSQKKHEESCVPGSLLLNLMKWNSHIEKVVNAWKPGTRIVVYCRKGCRSSSVAHRLHEYGFKDVFFISRSSAP